MVRAHDLNNSSLKKSKSTLLLPARHHRLSSMRKSVALKAWEGRRRRQSKRLFKKVGKQAPSAPSTASRKTNGETREASCEQEDCMLRHGCCLQISGSCSKVSKSNGNSSAAVGLFHISRGEHVCRSCYEDISRIGRPLYGRYVRWKAKWLEASRCPPTVRLFILDQLLPIWISCKDCGKYRAISRDSWNAMPIAKRVGEFTCSRLESADSVHDCSVPEEEIVADAKNRDWIRSLGVPPLLHNSPAIFYLREEYYYDEIGVSPMHAGFQRYDEDGFVAPPNLLPFNIPNQQSIAFSLRPDVMEYDELKAFPEIVGEPVLYLAMRNLVVALWNLNPFIHLTYEKCLHHLICPGLSRVWYSTKLKSILNYLTMKGVVNYGILPSVDPSLETRIDDRLAGLSVIVVGAGLSGLGVAKQLKRACAKVTVLEARDKIGGRMQDDLSLGVCVGCGAQLITGVINNPISLMLDQAGVSYRELSEDCPLLDSQTGKAVPTSADRLVDEHFNCMLDCLGHWKRNTKSEDSNLHDRLLSVHEALLAKLNFPWTEQYDRLLQWQLGNVTFSCGATLSDVSALAWDQNESVGQFGGPHALMSEGSNKMLAKLAEGIEVKFHHAVTKIDYSSANVAITCANGKKFVADKVVICIPLAVYKKKMIKFTPELPRTKQLAIEGIGTGAIEKVAVRFGQRFWSELVKRDGTLDYFGHVPKNKKEAGMFNIFYDFTPRGRSATSPKGNHYVLMSYVCGEDASLANQKTDAQIVTEFVDTLKRLFPDKVIPRHNGYVVTRWGQDPYIGMSYSYLRIGATGEDYDRMAACIDDKLYFAGECTNRFFPQTMTGAYMSALREAGKIMESWIS